MPTFRTFSKRTQYQEDVGLMAETPEAAALLVATGASNAPNVSQQVSAVYEVDVFAGDKLVGHFMLDTQHHIVKPSTASAPAPAPAPNIPARTPASSPVVEGKK